MYRIYAFLERHREFPHEPNVYWSQMAWFVDASFSLWRSAFLTDTSRDRTIVYEHTKEFVKKLLEHNAITFADDHRMRSLSVGYYNANVRYRLQRFFVNCPEVLEMPSCKDVAALDGKDLAREDQSMLWGLYHEALKDCFELFVETWNSKMRPGRVVAPDETTATFDSKEEPPPATSRPTRADGQDSQQTSTQSPPAWSGSSWATGHKKDS
jgi:hypothetical protein